MEKTKQNKNKATNEEKKKNNADLNANAYLQQSFPLSTESKK